ncbi:MAG: hypothetical protein K2H83_08175 [Duncaniella sp.]|nr:hypothetical protein [Duncaniella sp.]MDE6178008.1 hypothetical protein [Duncaniella sp.]
MENDDIKSLFDGFNPRLSSGADFMARLDRNLERVEMIKAHQQTVRRRGRLAVLLAALAGFVMGALMTLAVPSLTSLLMPLTAGLSAHVQSAVSLVPWILTALVSMGASWEVFDMVLARK